MRKKDSSLNEVGYVLWHSLNESGHVAVYDVEWPDGTVETDIPARMLEGVKKTEHADESATMGQHEAHGVKGHRLDSAINERKYKKRKSKKKVDYKKAYKKYHSSKKAKQERAQRNRIGRKLKKAGIKIPKGHEIDHITPISMGGGNNINNIRIIPRSKNRRLGQKITTNKRKKNGSYKK